MESCLKKSYAVHTLFINIMYYISAAIEVPESDAGDGTVRTYRDAQGRPVDRRLLTQDLLNVKCRLLRPRSAYVSVNYRGRWFYIDDDDVQSKDTFALLGLIFSLHSGEATSTHPVLTLPVGGN